jgi:putative ABC transport system substrate-binding protein
VRRRELIQLIAGTTVASPVTTRAQEPGHTYRLGFLIPTERETPVVAAFFDELRRFGFIEGQNLTVVPGGFAVRGARLAETAAAVVKASPDAIVCGPDRYAQTLQEATRTVPLICLAEDMVAEGLVASLARPGGNTTGISLLSPEARRQATVPSDGGGAQRAPDRGPG